MPSGLSDSEVEEALETCASEPVHIPGTVQPFACLLALTAQTGLVEYASANCLNILGQSAEQLLGADLRDKLGADFWHDVRNAQDTGESRDRSISLGRQEILGAFYEARTFKSDDRIVLEIEPAVDADQKSGEGLASLSLLMVRIQSCQSKAALFDLTVDLLRHLTSYDRVSLHQFDNDGSGEILAESKRTTLESWIGLRFPAQDIPRQAREIIRQVPLRFIQDVDQTPSAIFTGRKNAVPLDISLAATRGVSDVHMQYLRNMGVGASLTLSIVVEGSLWGVITFHSTKPRVPSPALRDVLVNFLPLFTTKLQSLEQAANLKLVERINGLSEGMVSQVNEITDLKDALPMIAPVVMETLSATGVAIVYGSQTNFAGTVPTQSILEELKGLLEEQKGSVLAIDDLQHQFGHQLDDLRGCAGALIAEIDSDRHLFVFRPENLKSVNWAGNPEKRVERVKGNLRIQPRGSFSTYLQEISGRSKRWNAQDIYFAERFLPVISSAERKVLMVGLQRQQTLMIAELNHRVRNILALVRSVSRQASRSFGSLQSYSKALETRIQALAAAHDLTSHSFDMAVSIRGVIRQELDPYAGRDFHRVDLHGSDGFLRPEIAPVFSLILHELATNCAKYGSLSVSGGRLDVQLEKSDLGLWIRWKELDGPKVEKPSHRGFGSVLIEQAAAFELNGTSELIFDPDGVRAEIFLPHSQLERLPKKHGHNSASFKIQTEATPFRAEGVEGVVLMVEDNYVIALDTEEILEGIGFASVETISNVEEALEFLSTQKPVFALLDVNLGRNETCEPIALRLQDMGVPFVLSTGYREIEMISPKLSNVPRIQKPIAQSELELELHRLFPS